MEDNKKQRDDRSAQDTERPDTGERDLDANTESGTPDEAFKAATHGTEEAPHTHPHRVEHPRESTGRHADESWKKKKEDR